MTTGFKVTQIGGYKADLDDILIRREYFNDGSLWAWGSNSLGRLGDGTTTNRSSPVTTAGSGINWKQIGCGDAHTTAIKSDGTLWTWGSNNSGRLGTGTTTARSSPGTTAGGGANWKQVDGGTLHTGAIKTDGTLWMWGGNGYGRLGDGTVTNRSSPVTTAGGGTNWKQVSCGYNHTAAVKTDGTLWAWGDNYFYWQLGDGTSINRSSPVTTAGGGANWKQVSAGGYSTAAVKSDGTLWTWGNGASGQLGETSTFYRSSPGTTSGGGTDWKQVSCGYSHMAAIKTNGTLWTWGQNGYGRLGDGTTANRSSPVTTAGGGANWKQVSGGKDHTAAVKTDGTLWTWGRNNIGQLGDNTTTDRSSPGTTVSGGTNWKEVSCGYSFSAALTDLTI